MMHLGSVLLVVALCTAAEAESPAPTPQTPPPAADSAAPPPPTPSAIVPPSALFGEMTLPPAAQCCDDKGQPFADEEKPFQSVWGFVGARFFPDGRREAPNGQVYHPELSLDLDMNLWLWRSERLYLFGDMRYWGMQDDGLPVVDGSQLVGTQHPGWQGMFNMSKREVDLNVGAAWNYWGPWEARAFVFSDSNLNRGTSLDTPYGFNDGFGLENRYYLSPDYSNLGRQGYDVSRSPFLSLGWYPTKVMIGNDGNFFAPGPFARAYLIWDVPCTCCYLFCDTQLIAKSSCEPKLLEEDLGMAILPFKEMPLLEFRLGSEATSDYESGVIRTNWLPYLSVRLNY